MRLLRAYCVLACAAGARLLADNNPAPSQSPYSVYPPYEGAGINQPFPDSIYGADHGGSSIALGYPYLSPFGYVDHSHGVITYTVAPFSPRDSEGVYGMDVWLEQQNSSGNWNVSAANGGVSDQGIIYQPVNTPNPGPSPGYTFTWTYRNTPLPPNTNFRVFAYVYLYNQGGGSQGNFYVASAVGPVNTGAANDAPRISWTASSGVINPMLALAYQAYTISADAQDDNGNLATVCINKNGQPFAYAGGGNGYSGNSQNPSSDPPGVVTYTAWATDSLGASSPTITWTVNNVGRFSQTAVSSSNSTLQFGSQSFTPGYYGGSGSGAWQFCIAGYTNWTVAADANSGTELAPSNVWSTSWPPPAPGTYYFWVAKDGDGTYYPSAPAGLYTLTVTPPPPPPTATISATPATGASPLTTTISWTTANASSVVVSGTGVSSTSLSGASAVSLATPGTYIYTLVASGPGGQVSQSATATVTIPQYTVYTFAVGNGSVTPGGVYPENISVLVTATPGSGAWFTGWTGSLSGTNNPLTATVTGNLTLYANFSPLQAQTIVFSPPATIMFPASPITLAATASSGLPVTFTIVSGPATLTGNQLTITGAGPIDIQATQAGNGQWLAAAPVSEIITANAPPPVLRIRFNPAGADARVTRAGASMISTDPAGLQTSPWPSFANPQAVVPGVGSFSLPSVPGAPILHH